MRWIAAVLLVLLAQPPAPRADAAFDEAYAQLMTAATRYVKEFTLRLSPDQFDFGRNVTVVVNGRVAFDGGVEKSVETLRTWAARDNDRTMLFAAELKITP